MDADIVIMCGMDDYPAQMQAFGSLSPRKGVQEPQLSMSGKCTLCDRTFHSCQPLFPVFLYSLGEAVFPCFPLVTGSG